MLNVPTHARSAGRAARAAFLVSAMLISGCFNAGPSVKQAMTSGAPLTVGGTNARGAIPSLEAVAPSVAAPARAAAARSVSFNLDKPSVRRSVATFQTELRDFFHGALRRSGKYVPTMANMLVHEGLPAELAYLPLIESGYRPLAVSPAGAVGPWQFIPETGKRYGLRIDSMVDERRDPIKSTEAAAQYLKDLHDMFGDWELSLAAYNSGENRVARIIADTGAPDYWAMRDRGYLPSETSAYVPRFLAAVRIAKAPQEYGFVAPAGLPFTFETVHVDRQLSLTKAAGFCGVSASELAELNPALRRGITPSGYALRVPAGAAEPLRAALANSVEPARPLRRVARARRETSRGSALARADRRRQTAARGASPRRTARSLAAPARERSPFRRAPRAASNGSRRREAQSAFTVAGESAPKAVAKPPKPASRARRRSG